ncbi:MAG: electron transport complex subunit RsxE [Bacilli bacterium]
MSKNSNSKGKIILNGIFTENPILSLALGLCPVIVSTQSIDNAIGMGVAILIVLVLSNLIVSLIKDFIPSDVRIPVYIVIIASLVTCVQLLMEAYTPELADSLGEFLPLITVNCIILGRAEAFAAKNSPVDSIMDAIGMSLGFFLACLVIAFFREFLGTGGLVLTNPFTNDAILSWYPLTDYAIPVMIQATGGFLWIGIVMGLFNMMLLRSNDKKARKEKEAAKLLKASAQKA